MAQDDAPVGAAGRPRGFDENVLAVGKHETARYPRVDHPACDGEHEDDVEDTAADDVEDEQGEEQRPQKMTRLTPPRPNWSVPIRWGIDPPSSGIVSGGLLRMSRLCSFGSKG